MASKIASRAKTKRSSVGLSISYSELNSLSSATLYDTVPKRKRGRLYEVERIIARRKVAHGHEFLLKWKGWPFNSCSWEPSQNLTPDLLRSYNTPPRPTTLRMEIACRDLFNAIQTSLKAKSFATIYLRMELDVWRYITVNRGIASEHKGYTMYHKEDFNRFKDLPCDWYYYLDQHGQGMAVDFPVKAKPVLSW